MCLLYFNCVTLITSSKRHFCRQRFYFTALGCVHRYFKVMWANLLWLHFCHLFTIKTIQKVTMIRQE